MTTITIRAASECQDCKDFGEFDIDENNTIRTPGKFEGEQDFAVHFYHAMMDGCLDRCACDGGDYTEIEPSDAALFEDLKESVGGFAHVYTSEQGFFYCEIVSPKELEDHQAEQEEQEEEEEEAM